MALHLIREQSELPDLLDKLMSRQTWGYDTETTGTDPHKDKVLTMQFGNTNDQYIVDCRRVNIEPLRLFLESKEHKKVAHFGIFDYMMIKGSFGIDVENMRCTFLAENCLNTGRKKGGYGLAALLASYLGVVISKEEQKSFIGHQGDFTENQLKYMATDVEHILTLCKQQCEMLVNTGTMATWQLECNVLPALGDMQFHGAVLDKEHWLALVEKNKAGMERVADEMNFFADQFFDRDLFGGPTINYGSPQQVLELLQRFNIQVKDRDPKTGADVISLIKDTSDKTIKKIVNPPKLVQLLKEYRSYAVRVNTFGMPFIEAIHPVTGRLHPDIKQMGTETGRLAKGGKGVNFLNVPRDKDFRKGFRGEADELIETDDYSGCELRIWAHLSRDPTLVEAFQKGEDVHCKVASKLFKREVTKKDPIRSKTKTLNFGIIYGMGVGRLHESLAAEDSKHTFEDTRDLYNNYKTEMRKGLDYLREVGQACVRDGFSANLNGRRRYWILPDPHNRDLFPGGEHDREYIGRLKGIEREGGNHKIQSVNADITKYAMVLIRDYIKANKVRSKFMNQVYDEIVTRTHKDDSASFHEAKVKLMIKAGERWITEVPIEVEGEVLPHWTK